MLFVRPYNDHCHSRSIQLQFPSKCVHLWYFPSLLHHYNDVIMAAMASQITSPTIVYSTVYSGADQRKHQSSVSLAFVWGIHRWPANSPHKWPVTRKMLPFDDVIMRVAWAANHHRILEIRFSFENETQYTKVLICIYRHLGLHGLVLLDIPTRWTLNDDKSLKVETSCKHDCWCVNEQRSLSSDALR